MPIPAGYNLSTDAYIEIHLRGFSQQTWGNVKRTCVGTEANVVAALISAMAKQPEIKECIFKAVALINENPDILVTLNKKL